LKDYNEVEINGEKIEQAHQHIDNLFQQQTTEERDEENWEEGDRPELPEQSGTVVTKYRVEAEIPKSQKDSFDPYRGFFGRHVAWSNFPRSENLAHIDAIDAAMIHDRSPTLRHLATDIKIKETSIFQMCRANEKRGGFEAELGAKVINIQDADVRHHHELPEQKNKKGKFLGIIPRRK